MYKTSIKTMVFILAFILLLTGCAKNQQSPIAVPGADITQLPDERAASAPPAQTLPGEPSASPTTPEDNAEKTDAAAGNVGDVSDKQPDSLPHNTSGEVDTGDITEQSAPPPDTLRPLEELGEDYDPLTAAMEGCAVLETFKWSAHEQWAEEFFKRAQAGVDSSLRLGVFYQTRQRIYDIAFSDGIYTYNWYEDGVYQQLIYRLMRIEDAENDRLADNYHNDPIAAEADGCVMELDGTFNITSGYEIWKEFFERSEQGEASSVRIVNGSRKDDLNGFDLRVKELEFDGTYYVLRRSLLPGTSYYFPDFQDGYRPSGKELEQGEMMQTEERFSSLIRYDSPKTGQYVYCLMHTAGVTYDELLASTASSSIGGVIPHETVCAVPMQ